MYGGFALLPHSLLPIINSFTARVSYRLQRLILWTKSFVVTTDSNETSSAGLALLHGTNCFSIFYKIKFGIFLKYDF